MPTILNATRPPRGTSYQDWLGNVSRTLRHRQPFRTHGALRGDTWLSGVGRMDPDTADDLMMQHRDGLIDYVIYSYATPIAWHSVDDGWVIPDQKFSPTTTRHQSVIRRAIDNI